MKLPFANELNYWKTSRSPAGSWLDKSEAMITSHGGTVHLSAKGNHGGYSAYCIEFAFGDDVFKAIWPVLPAQNDNDKPAAERQAATMLYHDIKARCMKIAIFSPRGAFFDMLKLPDGRLAGHLGTPELVEHAGKFLEHKP